MAKCRGRTATAMPSAARRRATWCRRPHGPLLAPHRLRPVLSSAGPSSPLSCTRWNRRLCTSGGPTSFRLPELLLAASTRSCGRRPPRPRPRASGSVSTEGKLSSFLPPPRHRASGSATSSQCEKKAEDVLQTVIGKVKGVVNEEEERKFEDKDYGFIDNWDQLAPPLSDNEHRISSSSGEEEPYDRWDQPDVCLNDQDIPVSSGEEEENFDVILNIDDIVLGDERIPRWSPHDSDYSKSDSYESDPLDLELDAIAKERLIRMLKAVEEEEEEKRERKREKKEEREERKRERKKRKKKERKMEKEERKEKREKDERKEKRKRSREKEERKEKRTREREKEERKEKWRRSREREKEERKEKRKRKD